MNKTTDNEQDRILQAAMQRRAAQVPPLADDFAERVMVKMNARRQRARRYRLAAAITSTAAAILIAFILWPESQDTTITQPEQQPTIAEVMPPNPVPKEKAEAETPVSEIEETPHKTMPASQTKRPQTRKVVAQATAIATTEEKVQSVIIDATPVTIENQQSSSDSAPLPPREGLGVGLPSDRQALADIYLAEAALQVAYQRQAQAEAMRAYAASLAGEVTPPAQPIIAF